MDVEMNYLNEKAQASRRLKMSGSLSWGTIVLKAIQLISPCPDYDDLFSTYFNLFFCLSDFKKRGKKMFLSKSFAKLALKHMILIYQSSKFSFSCVSLVQSVSREIDEIKLSPSHQRERETTHYSPVNNEKKSLENCECFVNFGKAVCFVDPQMSMFPSASPRETSTVSGPQNKLFPSVSVNKC